MPLDDSLKSKLQNNLQQVHERMAAACERSGRSFADVQLIAVTKYAPLEAVQALLELGQNHLGENRPQQLLDRAAALPPAHWHLIGHLQRNKVRPVLPQVVLIHSVDSLRLMKRIDEVAGELNLTAKVLLEVNVSGEESKDGFSPEELRQQLTDLSELRHVSIEGLMTMAPFSEDPEQARPWFRQLRELREECRQAVPHFPWQHLSMGMSGDFEIAIEEGATLIRVGSTLFEGISAESKPTR